jgi:flagellar L-ring protein precursor FlgH
MKTVAACAYAIRSKGLFAFIFLGIFLVLTGCQSLPKPVVVDFAEPKVSQPSGIVSQASPLSRPANGSLFQLASYRPAFEDRRARAVGDTVTIQIEETLNAEQKSNSAANRTATSGATFSGGVPLLAAVGVGALKVSGDSTNTFAGDGINKTDNKFTGKITATVIEVLANGHLVVVGEKQIGMNKNVDVLRFSGTVDPRLMQPGSVVSSTQVANVRVESLGRGAQGEAQTVGWLTRFFLNFLPI